ncbi:MAG: hypothetical protein HOP34_15605 [Methylococcaceae bacterium]|nr:hypothetical protein [Methylococcaceae bacterium]
MTDDELKALVASFAEGHKEIWALLKCTIEQLNRTDEQLCHTDEQQKRTDEQLQQTVEQMQQTVEQMKRTDEQMKRTDEQLKRTDEKLARIGITVGNISHNQGDVAEEFFYQSLVLDNRLGPIRFDDVVKNMQKHRGQLQEEYDLVMTNGDALAVVEVKYKAHQNDLDKLDRKMRHFKKLFPIYQSYKQYGAIATFHINDAAKAEALRRGYFVLQRSGNLVHTESGEHLAIL